MRNRSPGGHRESRRGDEQGGEQDGEGSWHRGTPNRVIGCRSIDERHSGGGAIGVSGGRSADQQETHGGDSTRVLEPREVDAGRRRPSPTRPSQCVPCRPAGSDASTIRATRRPVRSKMPSCARPAEGRTNDRSNRRGRDSASRGSSHATRGHRGWHRERRVRPVDPGSVESADPAVRDHPVAGDVVDRRVLGVGIRRRPNRLQLVPDR